MKYPSEENDYQNRQVELICRNYRQLLGESLIIDSLAYNTLGESVFYASFPILSHSADSDPLFNYVNLKAMELFGFDWDEFIGLPSRYSAAQNDQAEREQVLKEVERHGFVKNYKGVRVTKAGVKFSITDSVVWNLWDTEGVYAGQAACLKAWDFI